MSDIFDYLYWRGDLMLNQLPFNPVDGLILSWFASLRLKEPLPATLGQAAKSTDSDFAQALARSPRFKDMQLYRFDEQFSESEEMQFAAVTILTGDGRIFIAFRGTDSTLVGWKEDFNMSFMDEVPAQREAVDYINRIGDELKLPMRAGGHSKGGNLAMYAASQCSPEVQRRIGTVYNFDGPGLSTAAAQSDGYRTIESRIETFLPESSIVGILLERSEQYHVVKSSAESAMQHNPYSWQVMGGRFITLPERTRESRLAEETIKNWLADLSPEERKRFIDGVYSVLSVSDGRNVADLFEAKNVRAILHAVSSMDEETKNAIIDAFRRLGSSLRETLPEWVESTAGQIRTLITQGSEKESE